jgi:hypothetical protein
MLESARFPSSFTTGISLGDQPGGLWGLFTSYDFIAPEVFRVQGWGLGPGISLAKRWGWFEQHATMVAEILPWAGGGTTQALGVRDYHYGPGANAVVELRSHITDHWTIRLEGRQYWISGMYSSGQSENISFARASTTIRVYKAHGVSAVVLGLLHDFAGVVTMRAWPLLAMSILAACSNDMTVYVRGGDRPPNPDFLFRSGGVAASSGLLVKGAVTVDRFQIVLRSMRLQEAPTTGVDAPGAEYFGPALPPGHAGGEPHRMRADGVGSEVCRGTEELLRDGLQSAAGLDAKLSDPSKEELAIRLGLFLVVLLAILSAAATAG